MARHAWAASISGTRNGTANVSKVCVADDPYTGVAEGVVNTDVGVLVADGATPTQAHVNTLNTDWTAFLASHTGDIVVSVDTAKVTTKNQFLAAIAALLAVVDGSSILT
jgi:hypothetical protein